MSWQKPKKLPKLTRRQRDGKAFGAWQFLYLNKPRNTQTDDYDLAVVRRRDWYTTGNLKWPRKFAAKSVSTMPEGSARAADAIAQLGNIVPEDVGGSQYATNAAQEAPMAAAAEPSTPPPPVPAIDAEPIPPPPPSADGWAADVAGAAADAGAGNTGSSEAEEAPRLRLQDFAWFDAALVTISKAAVGLQLRGQSWTMRLVGDVEAGRVGPPPKMTEPDGAESMMAFMQAAGTRWPADDPRERGRAAYERTALALIPETLPVPAWLKWFEAPVITAIDTAPIQWQTATKIKRDAAGNEVPPAPPAEAQHGERAAA